MNPTNQRSLYDFIHSRTFSDDEIRFMLDLEFVQDLANTSYLKWLSDNGYIDDPAFLNYLKYLLYWKQPEYSKYIVFPQCLYYLEMLQDSAFRFLLHNQDYNNLLEHENYLAMRKHSEEPKKASS